MAWLSTWKYRRKITIDNSNIDSDLTHFPVPVVLGTSVGQFANDVSSIFDEVGSDYLKIAITSSDGETQLYVEVEQWDVAEEKALLWVSKSGWVISSDSDTEIYIYYDVAADDNTAYIGTPGNRTEVWDSAFAAVWTGYQNASEEVIDSTGNGHTGSKKASGEPAKQPNGLLGISQDFDGSDDYFLADNSGGGLTISGPQTYVALLQMDGTAEGWQRVYQRGATNPSNIQIYIEDGTGVLGSLTFRVENSLKEQTIPDFAYGTPVLLVITFNPTNDTLVFSANGNDFWSGSFTADPLTDDSDIIIGAWDTSGGRPWNGLMGPLHISSTERSSSWRNALFPAYFDNLLTWGAEEIVSIYSFKGIIKVEGIEAEGLEVNLRYLPTHELVDSDYTTNSGTFELISYLEGLHYLISFPPSGSSYNAQILYGFDTTISG